MSTYKKLFFLLNSSDRSRAVLLSVMILLMAIFDMIGVASILPFMTVLSNPSVIETNVVLILMYQKLNNLGVENNQQFLFVLGIIMFVVLVSSIAFKALTVYIQVKFIQTCQFNLSKRLVQNYLYQPYHWFLDRHSADLGKSILSEVGEVIGNGLRPLIELIAKGMVTISLVFLLILVNPKLSFFVGFLLGGAYLVIFYIIRKKLNFIGEERLKNNELRFSVISEAFGGIKEIKIGGFEKVYLQRFSYPAFIYARSQTIVTLLGQLPRFFLEAIAFGGILLVILYLMKEMGSFNNSLPIIALYVFAGYRLIPALQQIYASFTQLTYVKPSLNKLFEDINNLKFFEQNQKEKSYLQLNKNICLDNISYNYPNSFKEALKNININIPAKSTVGFIGKTGSGKTTIIDIVLGLLEPKKGTLKIDGKEITKQNMRTWQSSIGYVPQQIFLSDDTVTANIAFGQKIENINQKAVEKASKIANLHQFVINELPNKYQTSVGERGIRLSGGQRQRIGIARALYHNPQILIFDEATSALDNLTEKAVMDAINNLDKNVTVILIAHRLSTLRKCEKIFLLENGEIKTEGTFKELIKIDENYEISAKK